MKLPLLPWGISPIPRGCLEKVVGQGSPAVCTWEVFLLPVCMLLRRQTTAVHKRPLPSPLYTEPGSDSAHEREASKEASKCSGVGQAKGLRVPLGDLGDQKNSSPRQEDTCHKVGGEMRSHTQESHLSIQGNRTDRNT